MLVFMCPYAFICVSLCFNAYRGKRKKTKRVKTREKVRFVLLRFLDKMSIFVCVLMQTRANQGVLEVSLPGAVKKKKRQRKR